MLQYDTEYEDGKLKGKKGAINSVSLLNRLKTGHGFTTSLLVSLMQLDIFFLFPTLVGF